LRNVLTFLSLTLALAIAHAETNEFSLVGLDEDGNPVEFVVEKDQYRKTLAENIREVEASTLAALKPHSNNAKWGLRTVVAGLGVSIEAGISKLIKLSAAPRFRLVISQNPAPVTP
jgi:hypothetical protein